jgi:putative zinc finger/helix-turn-helix YgiT family protein
MKKIKTDYCGHCDKMVDYTIEKREDVERIIKGERFFVDENVAVCANCGHDIFNNRLENENLKSGFKQYAHAHSLLTPEEIKGIRNQYGLNQKLFSKSLGFGEVTVQRYESGALPTKAFSDLIKRVKSPEEYSKILEANKSKLSDDSYAAIREKVIGMIKNEKNDCSNLFYYEQLLKRIFGNADIYNGFKEFDSEKLFAVTAYLLKQCKKRYGYDYLVKGLFIKILWFIETTFFQRKNQALIGIQFVKFEMGPVPVNYNVLIDYLKDANIISYEEIDYGNINQHQLFLNEKKVVGGLTMEEEQVINDVLDQNMPSNFESLSSQTHEDPRYINTNHNQPIPYQI